MLQRYIITYPSAGDKEKMIFLNNDISSDEMHCISPSASQFISSGDIKLEGEHDINIDSQYLLGQFKSIHM